VPAVRHLPPRRSEPRRYAPARRLTPPAAAYTRYQQAARARRAAATPA
jgi:hypothetical protein